MDLIKIIIATTKKYKLPDDPVYLPLQVGATKKGEIIQTGIGYQKDNTGENISSKNPSYCELTGLYWAWKNLDAEYIGLVHYRRYFASPDSNKQMDPYDRIVGGGELMRLVQKYPIIVPEPRKYYIETLESHYAHTHYEDQLVIARKAVKKFYPEYLESFDKVLKQTSGYMFNMMILRRDFLNDYCTWLFRILKEIEKNIDAKDLGAYQGRYIGRIAEIIFNVWLDYQLTSGKVSKDDICELPCIHLEKINWFKKGKAFLEAKFFHKKYEHSF
ncbi:MAG: DUF4422 domain-containing protein [Butyrivibrio sp.]|nr:DUF4422 domain-containing protein [Butyrivibrio sp.]